MMLRGNGLLVREVCQKRQAFHMIERITLDEKLRYITVAVELGGLCKVKWRFVESDVPSFISQVEHAR